MKPAVIPRTLAPRLRSALCLAALAEAGALVEVEQCHAQTVSALAWAGITEDLKPNPFYRDVETQRNSGVTVGATILFTSVANRRRGLSASWTKFDDDDLRHLDVLGVLGLTRGSLLYFDLTAGVSWARFNSSIVGIDEESSIDFLFGPVLGLSLPLLTAAALDLSVVSQFRWSPNRTDYLRVGARVGLAVTLP